jgi:hypothetical protein
LRARKIYEEWNENGNLIIILLISIFNQQQTLCCKDMFEPFENLTIVCKLAGVDALLMMADELLLSTISSFIISMLGLYGCLSDVHACKKIK